MTQEKLPHRKELCLQSDTFLKNFFKNVFSSLIILHHTSLRILLFRRCKALSVDFSSLPSTLAIWV